MSPKRLPGPGEGVEPPPLKSYDIDKVLRLREQLIKEDAFPFYGLPLVGNTLRQLVAAFAKRLNVPSAIVLQSCQHVAGRELTDDRLAELAWMLAGNQRCLQAGRRAGPWMIQRELEWVPFQVVRALPGRDRKDQFGYWFDLRALAGSPASKLLNKFWAAKVLGYVSRLLGFQRFQREGQANLIYDHSFQFVRLRFYGLLEPGRSRDRRPDFHQVAVPARFKEWNRSILKLRYRIGTPCPHNYQHPCHRCSIGYVDCPAGTHPTTYVEGECRICKKTTYFDYAVSADHCVACAMRLRSRPKQKDP